MMTWREDSWFHPSGKRRHSCWTSRWTRVSWVSPACWRWFPPCKPGSSRPRSTGNKICGVTEETDKQLDPSRLRAKTRSQCQDCVAAFLKVTPPSLPVFFTLARLKHFSQLPSSPAAKLGNNKFRRNSRASALSNGNWILSNFYLFLFVCERCHLKAHYSDCLRTLLRCLPPAVADCVLGLHTWW